MQKHMPFHGQGILTQDFTCARCGDTAFLALPNGACLC